MKKWQIKNLETLEISEISEILFQVFLFLSFWFCPTAKIENSDLKILIKKNFEIPEVSEFSIWPAKLVCTVCYIYKQRILFSRN